MAKKSQNAFAAKNWLLVAFAMLLLTFGLVVLALSVTLLRGNDWAIIVGLVGLVSVFCSVQSLRTNDPEWILFYLWISR